MKIPKPRKLKNGGYAIYLRLGGKRLPPVYGRTQKECREAAAIAKLSYIKRGPTADITLREACERQIARREKQARSPETIRGYDVIMRTRFQDAMDCPVSEIHNWQELYDRDAAHLSQKTMKNTWAFIRGAVKDQCGLTVDIETPENKPPKEHLFLEPEQIPVFVEAAAKDPCGIAMLLELSSLRASEVRALEWSDVDVKNRRIHVSGAVVKDKNNQWVEKAENKTEESTRYVPIVIPELLDLLSKGGKGKVDSHNPDTLRKAINRICRENDLPEIGNHGLRHSFASLCYSLQIPIKITMQIGGWSDYNTILKVYTHLSKRDVNKYTDDLFVFFTKKNLLPDCYRDT